MAVFDKNEETISSAIHFSNKKTPVHPKRLYRSLWIKMVIVKERRLEEVAQGNAQSLAHFMDDP